MLSLQCVPVLWNWMGDIRAEVAALMLVVLKQVLWNQFVFLPATFLLLFYPCLWCAAGWVIFSLMWSFAQATCVCGIFGGISSRTYLLLLGVCGLWWWWMDDG